MANLRSNVQKKSQKLLKQTNLFLTAFKSAVSFYLKFWKANPMKIFVMRHGEAEVMAKSDKARHLTEYGKKQSFAQGEWLKNHVKSTALSFDRVLVSPYQRALETFEQVDIAFDSALNSKREIWDGITPYGSAELVVDYLSVLESEGAESVLLISHLPLVGEIVAELYGKRNPISFYPATIAQIDWNGGKGEIVSYSYPPEML